MRLSKRSQRGVQLHATAGVFRRLLLHNAETFAMLMESPRACNLSPDLFFYHFDDVDDLLCNAFSLESLHLCGGSFSEQADFSDVETLVFQGKFEDAASLLYHSFYGHDGGCLRFLTLRFLADSLENTAKFGQILFVPNEEGRGAFQALSISMTLTKFSKYALRYYVSLRQLALTLIDDANIIIDMPALPLLESLTIVKQDINTFEIVDLLEHFPELRDLQIQTSIVSYNNLNLRREAQQHIGNKLQQDIRNHQSSIQNVMFAVGKLQRLRIYCISDVPVDIFLILITLQPQLEELVVTSNVVDSKFTSLNFDVLEKLKREELQLYDDSGSSRSYSCSSQYDQIVHRLKNSDTLLGDLTGLPSLPSLSVSSSLQEPSELEPSVRCTRLQTMKLGHLKQVIEDDSPNVNLQFFDVPATYRRFRLRKCRSMMDVRRNDDFVEITSPHLREHLLRHEVDDFIRENVECQFPFCKYRHWARAQYLAREFSAPEELAFAFCQQTLRECELQLGKCVSMRQNAVRSNFECSQCQFTHQDIHDTVLNERSRLQSKHFDFSRYNYYSALYGAPFYSKRASALPLEDYAQEPADDVLKQQSYLLLILALPIGVRELNLCAVDISEYPLNVLLRQLQTLRSLTLLSLPVGRGAVHCHERLRHLKLCDQGYVQLQQLFDAFPALYHLSIESAIFDDNFSVFNSALRIFEAVNCVYVSALASSRLVSQFAGSLEELHMRHSVMFIADRPFPKLKVVSLRDMVLPFVSGSAASSAQYIKALLARAPNVEIVEYLRCREVKYCGKLPQSPELPYIYLPRLLNLTSDNLELKAALSQLQ